MPNVLVLYASTHGQTEKIATRLCKVLRDEGLPAYPHKAGGESNPSPADYGSVIIGASIHAGHHQHEILDWAKAHAATLNGMPTAFFSVSLSAADDTDEARTANQNYIDEFTERTGWSPRRAEAVAGALQYLEYDFMTKLVMRLMMRRGDHPTDTSRDYEYTDWDAVESFGRTCAGMIRDDAERRLERTVSGA